MPAALADLVVIALRGGDVAQSRAAAHYVDQHHRYFRAGDIGQALLHQADAGAGGGGHHTRTRAGCAVNHVDRAQFRFRLDKGPAELGHAARQPFQDFILWSDRIAEICLQSNPDGGLGNGLVTFPEFTCHINLPPKPVGRQIWSLRGRP